MNYKTDRWRRLRAAILKRDEYICQECKRYGITTEATNVHHVLPADECVGKLERFQFDSRNLISLCGNCHKAMHVSWNKELSAKGEALLKRKNILGLVDSSVSPL